MIRGLMSDAEWAFFEPFVIERGPKSGRPPAGHRRVLDGIFWIARTGAPWRDLPDELGKWGSVYQQFLRWTRAGLWDVLLEALADGDLAPDTVQMIDSTIVRAHHHAAGGKGGFRATLLAVRAAASRPKSTSGQTRKARSSRRLRLVEARHVVSGEDGVDIAAPGGERMINFRNELFVVLAHAHRNRKGERQRRTVAFWRDRRNRQTFITVRTH